MQASSCSSTRCGKPARRPAPSSIRARPGFAHRGPYHRALVGQQAGECDRVRGAHGDAEPVPRAANSAMPSSAISRPDRSRSAGRRCAPSRSSGGWTRTPCGPPRPVVGTIRAPTHAFRVQAVDRLVEKQHRRIAEQRGGDAQPLPHAKGEPTDPSPRHIGQPDLVQHLVTRRRGRPLLRASADRWAGALRPSWTSLASSSAPTWRRPRAAVPGTACRRWWRCRWWGRSGRGSSASSWSCRRRSGRGTRSPVRVRPEFEVAHGQHVAETFGQAVDFDHWSTVSRTRPPGIGPPAAFRTSR